MSYYRYKGIDARGRMKKGKMSAFNGADLEIRLRKMGLELISYKTARSPGLRLPLRRVKKRDLILFCFHLEQTLRAGVSILESLQDLRDSADNPRLREVCASMLESIEGRQDLVGSHARVSRHVQRGIHQPDPGGRANRRFGQHTGQAGSKPEMAGRTGIHGREADHIPGFLPVQSSAPWCFF